jgi:hypothetical protein
MKPLTEKSRVMKRRWFIFIRINGTGRMKHNTVLSEYAKKLLLSIFKISHETFIPRMPRVLFRQDEAVLFLEDFYKLKAIAKDI